MEEGKLSGTGASEEEEAPDEDDKKNSGEREKTYIEEIGVPDEDAERDDNTSDGD